MDSDQRKGRRNIVPKARSLMVHGAFVKTATKVGIAATKAPFLIKKIIKREGKRPNYGNNADPAKPKRQSTDNPATTTDRRDAKGDSAQQAGLKPKINTDQPKNNKQQENTEENSGQKSKETTKEEEVQKLEKLVENSHEVLIEASTVFPFTLFPDTITIDRNKINIHRRSFFFVEDVMSLQFDEITKVSCGVGPIFGSLSLALRMKPDEEMVINTFWRKDAIRLKRILQGYLIALNEDIDCNKLDKNELLEMLTKLGTDATL